MARVGEGVIESSLLDLVIQADLQRMQFEYDNRPGPFLAYLNPSDHPEVTEISGCAVKRSQYCDPGHAVVVRLWCAACGGQHLIEDHEGPLPTPTLTGIMDFIDNGGTLK